MGTGKWIDLTGQKFNRLTVIGIGTRKGSKKRWLCKCDCGNIVEIPTSNLKTGNTKSCGCYNRELASRTDYKIKHNQSKTRLYHIYGNMKRRCYDTTDKSYKDYGAKGTTVCEEWKNDYVTFMEWANKNGYTEKLTIDRIGNSKGYSPDNCRWVDRKTQANNTTRNRMVTINGETLSLSLMCDKYNISYDLVRTRIQQGWEIERALTTPKIKPTGRW